jgi:hypothetical protein
MAMAPAPDAYNRLLDANTQLQQGIYKSPRDGVYDIPDGNGGIVHAEIQSDGNIAMTQRGPDGKLLGKGMVLFNKDQGRYTAVEGSYGHPSLSVKGADALADTIRANHEGNFLTLSPAGHQPEHPPLPHHMPGRRHDKPHELLMNPGASPDTNEPPTSFHLKHPPPPLEKIPTRPLKVTEIKI